MCYDYWNISVIGNLYLQLDIIIMANKLYYNCTAESYDFHYSTVVLFIKFWLQPYAIIMAKF